MLAQVTELRTALHSEKLEREGVEAEFAEVAERSERETAGRRFNRRNFGSRFGLKNKFSVCLRFS